MLSISVDQLRRLLNAWGEISFTFGYWEVANSLICESDSPLSTEKFRIVGLFRMPNQCSTAFKCDSSHFRSPAA